MPDSTKSSIRSAMRRRRRTLTARQQAQAGQSLAQHVAHQAFFMRSQRLAFYLARDGELDPASLVAIAATAGKTPLLPVLHPLNHRQLYFLPFQSGQPLVRNRFGIPEPDLRGARPVSPLTIDVIFLPLVAFDSFGNRLGMGGGFYDRTLAGLPRQRRHPLLIGVAHSFQLVDSLPREPWDIPLHGIATEHGMVWPTGTSA